MKKTMQEIKREYSEKEAGYNKKYDHLSARIDRRERQITQLKAQLDNLEWVSWVDGLIKPIAEELSKHFPDRQCEVTEPFGISGNVSIYLTKKGAACLSITFRPIFLNVGGLRVVDYTKPAQNLNYPVIPMPEDAGIEWVLGHLE